ncbi:MAG: ABC transporter permease, partial [Burkholderiaceae bacterium]
GLGLVLGVLNVFVRDVGQVVPIVLQLGFWMTPIVYPASVVPEAMRGWLALNPMVAVVGAYHDLLVFGRLPPAGPLLAVAVLGCALLGLGLFMFRRASAEMVDAL